MLNRLALSLILGAVLVMVLLFLMPGKSSSKIGTENSGQENGTLQVVPHEETLALEGRNWEREPREAARKRDKLSPGVGTVVRCILVNGDSIAGVDIFGWVDNEEFFLGTTSDPGEEMAEFDLSRFSGVSARSSQGATKAQLVKDGGGWPEIIELVLETPGRIAGEVHDSKGRPVEGVHVLAFQATTRPRLGEVRNLLNGGHSSVVLLETTGLDGRFTLEGAKQGSAYLLVAAGSGVCVNNAGLAHYSGETDISLTASPVYGIVVEFRSIGPSGPMPLGSAWVDGPQWTAQLGVGERPLTGSLESALLGVTEAYAQPGWSRFLTVLLTADTLQEAVGPIHISCTPAGCEGAAAEVAVPRVKGTRIDRAVVECERLVDNLASATVELLWPDDGFAKRAKISPGRPMATIEFYSLDREIFFKCPLFDLNVDSVQLDSIPVGTYEVNFRNHAAGWSSAEQSGMPVITVSESAENRVEIDLRFTRSLEFQVQRPNGENYGGRFTFELQPRSGGAVEMMSFAQAPYLLRGVLPGDYLALFFDPFSTRVERPLSITKSSTEGKIVYDVSEQ